MKEIYSMNIGWRFGRETKSDNVVGNDDFDMFSEYTKTGTLLGPGSDSFCDAAWEEVQLPHDWLAAETFDREGVQGFKPRDFMWYRKWFHAPEIWADKRIFLKFEGISCRSEVILNNICIAKSDSAYTPLYIEITDFLYYGQPNLLAVRTDNFRSEGWWYDGCGIYRDVWLAVAEESCFVEDGVFLSSTMEAEGKWRLRIRAQVDCPKIGQRIIVRCMGEEGFTSASECSELFLTVTKPPLWSMEQPSLVPVEVTLAAEDGTVLDRMVEMFGFRTVEFDAGRGCIVNGKPVKLRGVCLHQDHAGVGTAIPYELHMYRLRQLKAMGCNAIRTSHNPQSPGFYRACDELGFAVMDEVRHFSSAEEELHQLSVFVRRDRNHPCVFFWSLFNEEPLQCSTIGERIARTMKRTVDKLDGTRMVSGGMNGPLECEGAVKVVDIMGFNYLQYEYDEFHRYYPDMPIVGSETSSHLTQRGENRNFCNETVLRRSAYGRVRSRSTGKCQNLLAWSDTPGDTWKRIMERNFVAGGFAWTGIDYRGEAQWPGVIADFGAMDLCCFPKDNFYWYQAMWRKNVLHAVRYMDEEHSGRGKLLCYTDGDKIRIEQDGCEIQEYANDPYQPRVYDVTAEGQILVTAFSAGEMIARQTIRLAKVPAQLMLICGDDKALEGGATVFNAVLLDENGEVCDLSDMVEFSALGGSVLGVGNGDTSAHEPENAMRCHLYHGRCQVIVRADEVKYLTVTAECGSFFAEQRVPVKSAEYRSIGACTPWLRICPWRMSDVLPEYPKKEQIHDLMFNWIPTMAGVPKSLMMSGKHGYACFAGMFTAPQQGSVIHMEQVTGKFDLYLSGERVLSSADGESHNYILPLPESLQGKRVGISMVFACTGNEVAVGNIYLTGPV